MPRMCSDFMKGIERDIYATQRVSLLEDIIYKNAVIWNALIYFAS